MKLHNFFKSQTGFIFCSVILWLCFLPKAVSACDFCGCGVGNYYFGAMPMFHKNMFGFRYRQFSFDSHLGSPFQSNEKFSVSEAYFRFYPHRKWQVVGFIPYAIHSQKLSNEVRSLSGLSDVMTMISYNVWNNQYDSSKLKHILFLGMGIKLPTGKYKFDKNDEKIVANENFQLGTGSTDFILNIFYSFRWDKWRLNTTANYKVNTKNDNQYRFGNRYSVDISLLRIQQIHKRLALAGSIGLYGESSKRDERNGYFVNGTGGNLLMFNFGLDTFISDRIFLGTQIQKPIYQRLSDGMVKALPRWSLQMGWLF